MKFLIGVCLVALAVCSPSASGKSQLSLVVHSDGKNGTFSSTIASDKISMHIGQQYGIDLNLVVGWICLTRNRDEINIQRRGFGRRCHWSIRKLW